MVGAIHIVGVLCLLTAFFLLLFASLSLPVLKSIYFLDADLSASVGFFSYASDQLKLGAYGFCYADQCSKTHLGFDTLSLDRYTSGKITDAVSLVHDLSYALVLNPIAAVGACWALPFFFGAHFIPAHLGSLFASMGTFVTLLALIFDLAVFVTLKHHLDKIYAVHATLGNAVWMVVVAFILQFFSTFMICCTRSPQRVNADPKREQQRWFGPWKYGIPASDLSEMVEPDV